MQDFIKSKQLPFTRILFYYSLQFLKRLELLLPLSLLIASIKVLCSLNRRYELLAFQVAGIKIRTLLRPFFIIAFISTLLIYLNFEFALPKSLNQIDQFQMHFFKRKKKHDEKSSKVHVLPLKDGSHLIYQNYNISENIIEDAFWIVSADEIWYAKSLTEENSRPIGHFVDHLKRNEEGQLIKIDSYEEFPLKFKLHVTKNQLIPFENRSIRNLIKLLFSESLIEKQAAVKTQLYYKLVIPFLPIFVALGCIPSCLSYSRRFPTFLIYAISLIGLIAFLMIMNGCIILGNAGVFSPFWSICTIPIILMIFLSRRFLKRC